MWELDCEEGWALKNWCFWTVVLEKTLESPLDCKEIQPVHCEGDQFWDFFGGTDAKAEPPVLWPPHAKSWLIGKESDAGRDWGQEEKGMTENEMPGWHHWLDGHEFGWTPGVGDGQGGLASCNSWGRKESDTTERVNWTNWTELKCSYVLLKMKQHRYKRSPFLTFSNSIVFLLSFATWGNHYPSVLLNFYRTHLVLYIVNGTYVVLANIFSSPRIIGPLTKFSFSSLFFRFFC